MLARPAERGADRGRDGAVDAGRGRGWRSPCGGRRRRSAAPSGRGRGSGCEAPTTSRPPGGSGAADRAGDLVRREAGLGGEQRVELRGRPTRSAVAPRLEPGRVVGPVDGEPAASAVDGERPLRPARRAAGTETTSTSSRAEQPGDRPGQRRVPEDHDPLDLRGRGRCRAAAGSSGARSRRCASRWCGSASSGQPARSASTRAGGPASSPATTTVRGPSGQRRRASAARPRRRRVDRGVGARRRRPRVRPAPAARRAGR